MSISNLYLTFQVEGLVLCKSVRLSVPEVSRNNVIVCRVRLFTSKSLETVKKVFRFIINNRIIQG